MRCILFGGGDILKIASTAQRLQQILSERNLKQTDVIRLAEPYCKKYRQKLGRSDLSQFVNGKVVPGQWKLTLLSLALDVSETWLMGYDVPQEREPQPSDLIKPLSPAPAASDVLTEKEQHLLTGFRDLNELGQEAVLTTLDGFTHNPVYKKCPAPASADKQA